MLKYEGWTKQSKMHLRSGKYKFYVRMDFTIPTRTVRIRIFSTKYGSFLKRVCTCISGWLVVKKDRQLVRKNTQQLAVVIP